MRITLLLCLWVVKVQILLTHACRSADETITLCELFSPPRRRGLGADLIRACRSANWTAAERGDPPWGGWWMDHQLADGAVLPEIQVLVMKSNVFGCFFVHHLLFCCRGWPQEVTCFSNLIEPGGIIFDSYSPAGSRTHHTNTVPPQVHSG